LFSQKKNIYESVGVLLSLLEIKCGVKYYQLLARRALKMNMMGWIYEQQQQHELG
jgi:hypothetical protein